MLIFYTQATWLEHPIMTSLRSHDLNIQSANRVTETSNQRHASNHVIF